MERIEGEYVTFEPKRKSRFVETEEKGNIIIKGQHDYCQSTLQLRIRKLQDNRSSLIDSIDFFY